MEYTKENEYFTPYTKALKRHTRGNSINNVNIPLSLSGSVKNFV